MCSSDLVKHTCSAPRRVVSAASCVCLKADDDDFGFGDLAVGKKKAKGGKAAPKAAPKITLTLDTISSLSTIGVSIPVTAAEVQGTIDKVRAKKKEFEGKTEEDKKAFKASKGKDKASKESKPKKEKADAGKTEDKTEYPSLGAS